ncbi:MAG: phosphotransferase [Anaerolineaceae bacterium]|nr:phosphotransferase [Anaerolineaceae bacterium]
MKNNLLIGSGRTADVYQHGEGRILKLYQKWISDNVVEQEFNITRTIYDAGFPVPKTFEIIQHEGRFGIVFEHITGISMLDELQARPWNLFTVARQLAELHTNMHEILAPAEFPNQRKQIADGIDAASQINDANKRFLQNHLSRLPKGDSLCHGDFHPDNIILSPHGPIIIDWMTGTHGNPLADVARTCMLFQISGLPPGIPAHMRLLINLFRSVLNRQYLKHYLKLRPAKQQQIDQWNIHILAARLRETENFPQEQSRVLARLKAGLMD